MTKMTITAGCLITLNDFLKYFQEDENVDIVKKKSSLIINAYENKQEIKIGHFFQVPIGKYNFSFMCASLDKKDYNINESENSDDEDENDEQIIIVPMSKHRLKS